MAYSEVHANDSVITYKGQLTANGELFSGSVDLAFELYDEAVGGKQIATALAIENWQVEDGLLLVELEFDSHDISSGTAYLQVSVDEVKLSPRQRLKAAPVALFALNGIEGPPGEEAPSGPQGPTPEPTDTIDYCSSGNAAEPPCSHKCNGAVVSEDRVFGTGSCVAASDLGTCSVVNNTGSGWITCCVCEQFR